MTPSATAPAVVASVTPSATAAAVVSVTPSARPGVVQDGGARPSSRVVIQRKKAGPNDDVHQSHSETEKTKQPPQASS